MTKLERFINANMKHPIISGVMLDKDKRVARGAPKTWCYIRYALKNNTSFVLSKRDMQKMETLKFEPRWDHD